MGDAVSVASHPFEGGRRIVYLGETSGHWEKTGLPANIRLNGNPGLNSDGKSRASLHEKEQTDKDCHLVLVQPEQKNSLFSR